MIELVEAQADLKLIDPDEVPSGVRHHHDANISLENPLTQQEYIVRHSSGDAETYVMEASGHPMLSHLRHSGRRFSQVSVVDVLQEGGPAGVITGEGTIEYLTAPRDKHVANEDDGKAIVTWNGTYEDYIRRGFGRWRLLVMNAASQFLYGSVLHSGTSLSTGAERLWRKLVEDGLAEPFLRETVVPGESYRFTS